MQKSECATIKPTLPKFCGKIHRYTHFFFFGKLCKWHSVVQQDLEEHPESPRTVFLTLN